MTKAEKKMASEIWGTIIGPSGQELEEGWYTTRALTVRERLRVPEAVRNKIAEGVCPVTGDTMRLLIHECEGHTYYVATWND